jgi:hypothetical protein
VHRIGLLIPVAREGAAANVDAFRQALRDLGESIARRAAPRTGLVLEDRLARDLPVPLSDP